MCINSIVAKLLLEVTALDRVVPDCRRTLERLEVEQDDLYTPQFELGITDNCRSYFYRSIY